MDGVVYESARVSMYYGDMGDYQFVYDDNGNLTEIQLGGVHDGVAGETQYRYDYDSKGQLIREDNVPLNKTYTYTYDAAGNITAKRVYPFTTGALGIAEQTITYTYGDAQWGDLLTGWNGYTMQYGNVGNLEAIIASDNSGYDLNWQGRRLVSYIGTHSMDYNSADDIYSRIDFTYNADGIRTSKTVNGVEHQYILNGSQIIAERWTETVDGEPQEQLLIYLYDETGAPMGLAYHNEDYYENEYDRFFFHRSLQGDITAIYSNNRQIGSYTYDAWGNFTVTQAEGNTAFENLVLNTYNPFRYRGYYYDVETGLYYLQSRYYNPEWGRFISADGYISTGQGILGYNMFAYCINNPVNGYDPTGKFTMSAGFNFSAFLIGGASYSVNFVYDDDWNFAIQLTEADIFRKQKGGVFGIVGASATVVETWTWADTVYDLEGIGMETNVGPVAVSSSLDDPPEITGFSFAVGKATKGGSVAVSETKTLYSFNLKESAANLWNNVKGWWKGLWNK